MAAIFVVTFILLGFDFVSALIAFIVITMIIIDIMGMMYMWNINLNALSLVNLVMVGHMFIIYFSLTPECSLIGQFSHDRLHVYFFNFTLVVVPRICSRIFMQFLNTLMFY